MAPRVACPPTTSTPVTSLTVTRSPTKAQGLTTDRAFLGTDNLYPEFSYVALSRGREANEIYLPAPEQLLDAHRLEVGPPAVRVSQANTLGIDR